MTLRDGRPRPTADGRSQILALRDALRFEASIVAQISKLRFEIKNRKLQLGGEARLAPGGP